MTPDITTVKDQVEQFMMDTMDARALSEKCRDYFDHKQWTAAEIEKLTKRKQAPIVVNRIRPKVKGLLGLYNLRKSDPKAFPRTQKHEKSAHAITDAIRYVADQNDFGSTRIDVAEEFFIEGYGGASVIVSQNPKTGDVNIEINHIPWDRIYFDPHSRKKDFSDARFIGFYWWMGEDEAEEKFPDANITQLLSESDNYSDDTFEDRPRWFDKQRKRIRVAVHFCIKGGKWYFSIFSGNTFLREPEVSPYLDDDGDPCCPIELVCANIDRDNQRYGEVAGFLDQQDEINHRRSKALHLLSQRQTMARKGAIKDVNELKRELAKPDGHVEYEGESGDFEVMQTGDMAKGQFELYMDAKAELDAVSFNAQLAGERQQGDLSGRAIDKLQAAGTIELNQDYSLLAAWEKRIHRQIWARVKQFWTEEKWIRVTDDQKNLRWVGLNTRITAQEFLEEKIMDESIPAQDRVKYAASMQFLMQSAEDQDPMIAQAAQAKLNEFVDIQNPVPELDVDIILDQSFDVINAQQEQFEMLAKFGSNSDIDIIELIELSDLRGKEELIERIEKRRAAAAQAQQGAMEMESADRQADIQLKGAKAQSLAVDTQMKAARLPAEVRKTNSEAVQKEIENLLMMTQPQRVNSISV